MLIALRTDVNASVANACARIPLVFKLLGSFRRSRRRSNLRFERNTDRVHQLVCDKSHQVGVIAQKIMIYSGTYCCDYP